MEMDDEPAVSRESSDSVGQGRQQRSVLLEGQRRDAGAGSREGSAVQVDELVVMTVRQSNARAKGCGCDDGRGHPDAPDDATRRHEDSSLASRDADDVVAGPERLNRR